MAAKGACLKARPPRSFGVILSSVQRYLATGFMLGVVGWIVIYLCLELVVSLAPFQCFRQRGAGADILVYKPKALYHCPR